MPSEKNAGEDDLFFATPNLVAFGPQLVQISGLDGTPRTLDIKKAKRWRGKPRFDRDYELPFDIDLFRSQGGRWVECTAYNLSHQSIWGDMIPPEDDWREITLEHAIQWFLCEMDPSTNEEDSIPAEIEAQIAGMDIDSQSQPPNPLPTKSEPPAPTQSSSSKLSPGSMAVAAAYELQKGGSAVTLLAACKLAGVDRKNVARRYPNAVDLIRKLARPDQRPRHSMPDGRAGDIEEDDE